jgi:hypothetical protein
MFVGSLVYLSNIVPVGVSCPYTKFIVHIEAHSVPPTPSNCGCLVMGLAWPFANPQLRTKGGLGLFRVSCILLKNQRSLTILIKCSTEQ